MSEPAAVAPGAGRDPSGRGHGCADDLTAGAGALAVDPRAGWPAPLAAAGGGVLYFLGYVGWGVWPCLLVFLAPLWWALESDRARGRSRALFLGATFGASAYAGGFPWLWRLVDPFLDGNRILGAVLWVGYGAWFAAGFALYALAYQALRRRGRSVALAGVAPFLVLEWLQPQIFPLYAGSGLIAVPALVQTADLGGPLLLTAFVAGANVVAFETWAWWRRRRGRPALVWAAAAALALAALVYGRVRTTALDAVLRAAPTLHGGIVQANLGIREKDALSVVTHQRHLEQTRALLAAGAVDLVIWPETAYVRGIRRPLPVSGRPIQQDLSVPILFGAASVVERDGRRTRTNAAFLIDADGMIHDGYDKNLLIPLAEYLPSVTRAFGLDGWLTHVETFAAADETPALHLGPWRIATPICSEAIRPEFVRRMVVRAHPHLLVTLANDAWFGDSQEPWIHLALSRLRAVEHRRFLLRSTNSGISAVIDPTGRLVARTRLLAPDDLRAVVSLLEGETIYDRAGDWPGWLAAIIVLVALALPSRAAARNAGA